MGVDTADFENSGAAGVAITNFDNEMVGLYRSAGKDGFADIATQSGVGLHPKTGWDLVAFFSIRIWMGGWTLPWPMGTSMRPCGIFAAMWDTRSLRSCSLNQGGNNFNDIAPALAEALRIPKVGRGWPMEILIATEIWTC